MSLKVEQKDDNYSNLFIEAQRMWDMKCMILPVIIGSTGMVIKGVKKELETLPGIHSVDP